MNLKIQERDGGITIECFVTPRARQSEIKGMRDGALAIALTAPPAEGKANKALIGFIAEILDIPRSSVSILKGMSSRKKILFIQDITKNEAAFRILPHL